MRLRSILARGRDDRGSILIVALGMLIICVLAIGVVVDASTVFLERRSLQSSADSAALAGAQAIDIEAYYARGAADGIRLDAGTVRAAVQRFMRRGSVEGSLRAVSLSGDVVVVRLAGQVRPPFSGWLTRGGAYDIEVEAGATLSYRPAR
ncbi:MAG: pilus assembly protein TadG-related protein [Candidatus Nanopelagicales bacterium]